MNPFKRTINNGFGDSKLSLPRTGLLLYLGRPNLEASNVPLGDDTIIRWMFLLPADADIRAATGWVSGIGNIFYDAAGDPVAVLASEIVAWSSINQWNVLFHLVSADTETGRLAIYAQDTPLAILNKALKVLREDQIDVPPSAFFNGMDFRLASPAYIGGPTYVPDHLGVLRSPKANLPAVQGMRLATTVADGAVLGPEMVVNGSFDSSAAWTIANVSWSIDGGKAILSPSSIYGSTLRQNIGYVANTTIQLIADVTVLTGSIEFWISNDSSISYTILKATTSGTYTLTASRGGTSGILYIRTLSAGSSGSVDNISVREVIPIYINTNESGNPILPSTLQKTVTYNTDWTAKTFAETFDKFDISDPLKAPGWLCEPVRTNKVACRKSNPVDTSGLTKSGDAAAVLSVVDDTAALTAAGLIGLCNSGKVYKLDNSLGATVCYLDVGGSNANLTPHAVSAYVRGSGTSRVYLQTTSVPVATLTPTYQRVINVVTPLSRGVMGFRVEAGTVLYFILPQLEEGAFCTSPICKASDGSDPLTAITRAATVASFPTAGKIPVNDFAIRMIVVPRASGQSSAYCFGTYIDSNNYTAIIINPTSVTIRKRVSGISNDASVSITHANRIPLDLILYSSPATGIQVAGRAFTSSWGLFTDGAINATEAAKANAQIASIYQLGSLNGSSQFAGNISLFDCVPIPTGITDPMAWAKTHWGVA